MTAGPRKPTAKPRFTLPQVGPAARRAREAALDAAAARSKAARVGAPAPAPVPDQAAELAEARAQVAGLEVALQGARAALDAACKGSEQSLAALRETHVAAMAEAQAARREVERRLAEREAADARARRETAERQAGEARARPVVETGTPAQAAPTRHEKPKASTVADTAHRFRRGTGPGEARQPPRLCAPPAPAPAPAARPAPAAIPARPPTAVEPPPAPVPSRHGRIDPKSPHAGLLVMAPPRPGDRAGRIFAELLDRAAVKAAPVQIDDRDDTSALRNPTREDLRALACLWREAEHFYAVIALRDGDGLPLSGERMRRAAIGAGGGSVAGQVAEG